MVHFNRGADPSPPSPRGGTKQIQFHSAYTYIEHVISLIIHPCLVDRLNDLPTAPTGSTIVVENTTSKQQLSRTTTNKGKKLKSGNIIVWEANLPQ